VRTGGFLTSRAWIVDLEGAATALAGGSHLLSTDRVNVTTLLSSQKLGYYGYYRVKIISVKRLS